MTKEQIISAYTAPNPNNNVTMAYAKKFAAYMTALEMPFDEVVAVATNPNSPAPIVPISKLVEAGIGEDVPLNIGGAEKQDGTDTDGNPLNPKVYFIALEKALIANSDGVGAYVKLYSERHPGATFEQAESAMDELPVLSFDAAVVMEMVKKMAGV